MSITVKLRLTIACGLVLLISSCSQVAITGRKQFNLVPASVMNSLSFQSYSEFLSQNKLSSDARQTQMVKRVGAGIQKAVEKYCAENNLSDRLEGYKWEFNLVEDPSRPTPECAPLMRRSSLLLAKIRGSLQAGLSVCVGVETACCGAVIPPVRAAAESSVYVDRV